MSPTQESTMRSIITLAAFLFLGTPLGAQLPEERGDDEHGHADPALQRQQSKPGS